MTNFANYNPVNISKFISVFRIDYIYLLNPILNSIVLSEIYFLQFNYDSACHRKIVDMFLHFSNGSFSLRCKIMVI